MRNYNDKRVMGQSWAAQTNNQSKGWAKCCNLGKSKVARLKPAIASVVKAFPPILIICVYVKRVCNVSMVSVSKKSIKRNDCADQNSSILIQLKRHLCLLQINQLALGHIVGQ